MWTNLNRPPCLRTPVHYVSGPYILRKANEVGDESTMFYTSLSLFQMLLVLGPELQQRGIAYLFYPFYLKHILPLYSGYELDESAYGMARTSMILNLLAFVDERSSVEKRGYRDRVNNMYQWLIGFWGRVPATAFKPRFRPSNAGDIERDFNAMQLQRDSAWRTLIGIIANGRAPIVFRRASLDADLDYSVLAGHRREDLLAIAGQMLVK